MRIINSLTDINDEKIILSIGNFDGVHVGHQRFLKEIKADCDRLNAKFVIITFIPHPVIVLKARSSFLINSYEERRNLLEDQGVDYIIEIPFTRDFSTLGPKEFLKQNIFTHKNLLKIYLGHDFAFGANKSGGHKIVEENCKKNNVDFFVQEEFHSEKESVSSSNVRKSLTDGDCKQASKLLGRNFFVSGKIVKGAGRGKQIGFPTANLEVQQDRTFPQIGVYATKVKIKDCVYLSLTNIGKNPTFTDSDVVNIETYILDFDMDIYGETLVVEFESKIRDEKKFSSVNELISQIKKDVDVRRGLSC